MAIPDLTNNYVAANYRRVTVPFSRFGTRELAFYTIYVYNGGNDYLTDQVEGGEQSGYGATVERQYNANSIMAGIIQSIQTVAELYAVGSVETDYEVSYFTIAVSHDTYKDGNSDNYEPTPLSDHSKVIADVIDDYCNEAYSDYDGLDVYRAAMYGDCFFNFGYSYAMSDAIKAAKTAAFKARNPMKVSKKAAALAAKKK